VGLLNTLGVYALGLKHIWLDLYTQTWYYVYTINESEGLSMTTSINIRLDEDLKRDIEQFFSEIGLDTSTAIRMFFKQCLIEKALPFLPRTKMDNDRIIALEAKEALKEARAQAALNGTINMTMDEIDAEIQAYRNEKRVL
jgi:DNA-damage-inducible protein J